MASLALRFYKIQFLDGALPLALKPQVPLESLWHSPRLPSQLRGKYPTLSTPLVSRSWHLWHWVGVLASFRFQRKLLFTNNKLLWFKNLNNTPGFPVWWQRSIYTFTSDVHKFLVDFWINSNNTSIFIDLCWKQKQQQQWNHYRYQLKKIW